MIINSNALFQHLLDDGYIMMPPLNQEAARIDRGVCAEAKCDKCWHIGLLYRPFTKPGSYRAFAVCPQCGHATEF